MLFIQFGVSELPALRMIIILFKINHLAYLYASLLKRN